MPRTSAGDGCGAVTPSPHLDTDHIGSADETGQDVAGMEAEDLDGLGLAPVDRRKLLRMIADAKVR
jgi:hypothetical protein